MFDNFSVVTGIIASIISIIIGILTFLIIYRRRQLSRPKMCLVLGSLGVTSDRFTSDLKRIIGKKYKSLTPNAILFSTKKSVKYFLALIPYILKNDGTEGIKDIRLQIEYDFKYMVDNNLIERVYKYLSQEKPLNDKSLDYCRMRNVQVVGSKSIVSFEFPILRQGEKTVIADIIMLGGIGISEKQGIEYGDEGFNNILNILRRIPNLTDYFVVDAHVFSGNHETIHNKYNVFSTICANIDEINTTINKISNSFWFNDPLKPGIYFGGDRLYNWILKHRGHIGRLSSKFYRSELVEIVVPYLINLDMSDINIRYMEILEDSEVGGAPMYMPNCNYYALPNWVKTSVDIRRWMSISSKPIYTFKK